MEDEKNEINVKDKINIKFIIIALIICLFLITGFTYAYLVNNVSGESKNIVGIKDINIEYIDGESINTNDLQLPIKDEEVFEYAPSNTFSIKNNEESKIYLKLKISDIKSEILK